jgi:hypothetical protein
LNPSVRCGFTPNLRQIRPIVEGDRPLRLAIEVRDQCVAWAGVVSSVAVNTASTLSRRIEGGRPGRGSSTNPSKRLSTNRPRHLLTVFGLTPRSAATCRFVAPDAAHANTIRARNATACDDFARRDHRVNFARSSSLNTYSTPERPRTAPSVNRNKT